MGLFHTLRVGLQRKFLARGPRPVAEEKQYGDQGENYFAQEIQRLLPACQIKTNVLIHLPADRTHPATDAEIDCLVLFQGRLFAVEVKHWKGNLLQQGDRILKRKKDAYTDEVHETVLSNPFAQIKRAISLLKKETGCFAWIWPIVYFCEADQVICEDETAWFQSVQAIVSYIKGVQGATDPKKAASCFEKSREADRIVANNRCVYRCRILDDSFKFYGNQRVYTRKDIASVQVLHHFAKDEIYLTLHTGEQKRFVAQTASLVAYHDKKNHRYDYARLNAIFPGRS